MLPVGSVRATLGHSARQFERVFEELAQVGQQLATLQRVRRGSDDPAAMMAAAALRNQLRVAEETAAAAERVRGRVDTYDGALAAAEELLDRVHGHVVAGAGFTSTGEHDAMQLEIDAALDALDRLGRLRPGGSQATAGQPLTLVAGDESYSLETLRLDSTHLGSAQGTLAELRQGGTANLQNDPQKAIEILDAARTQITTARARGGAFQRATLDSVARVAEQQITALQTAHSLEADLDLAAGAAELAAVSVRAEGTARVAVMARRAVVPPDLL